MTENWYEIHYGNRVSAAELASFVSANAKTHVRTLTRLNADIIEQETSAQGKLAYFVDFFAPVIIMKGSVNDSNLTLWLGSLNF